MPRSQPIRKKAKLECFEVPLGGPNSTPSNAWTQNAIQHDRYTIFMDVDISKIVPQAITTTTARTDLRLEKLTGANPQVDDPFDLPQPDPKRNAWAEDVPEDAFLLVPVSQSHLSHFNPDQSVGRILGATAS